ncbi:unnamed protein product [Protopolystoma xenopodis]|uniref:Uncharacterized protein n=1 Tax=Protopolystoma xenopodis TaxID=117903 RepID=A0A3S5CER3_9PLAT|nr:unnamed protein product [Protopolystoma xenopodis]
MTPKSVDTACQLPPAKHQIHCLAVSNLAAQETSILVLYYAIFEDLEQMMPMFMLMYMPVPGDFLLPRFQDHDSIVLSLIPTHIVSHSLWLCVPLKS